MGEVKLILKDEEVAEHFRNKEITKKLEKLLDVVRNLTIAFTALTQTVEVTMGQLKDQLLAQLQAANEKVVDAEARLAQFKGAEDQEDVQQNAERDALAAEVARLQAEIDALKARAEQSLSPEEATEVTDQIETLTERLVELQGQLPEVPPAEQPPAEPTA